MPSYRLRNRLTPPLPTPAAAPSPSPGLPPTPPAPPAPPLPPGCRVVQVAIFYPPPPTDNMRIFEGTACTQADGSIVIAIDLNPIPPAGTPLQIFIYNDDGSLEYHDGETGTPNGDGEIPIILASTGGGGAGGG